MNQEEGSYQNPTLLASWSWTSQDPELSKINFCCLQTALFVLFCYSSMNGLSQIHSRRHGTIYKKIYNLIVRLLEKLYFLFTLKRTSRHCSIHQVPFPTFDSWREKMSPKLCGCMVYKIPASILFQYVIKFDQCYSVCG